MKKIITTMLSFVFVALVFSVNVSAADATTERYSFYTYRGDNYVTCIDIYKRNGVKNPDSGAAAYPDYGKNVCDIELYVDTMQKVLDNYNVKEGASYFVYYMKDNFNKVLFKRKIEIGDWSQVKDSYQEKKVRMTPGRTYKLGCFVYDKAGNPLRGEKEVEFKFRDFPTANYIYKTSSAWASYYEETGEVVLSTSKTSNFGNYEETGARYDSNGEPTWYLIREKVKSLYICDNVPNIGQYYFYKSQLEEVTLGSNTNWIKADAFAECSKLKRIYVPNTAYIFEIGAFRNLGHSDFTVYAPCDTTIRYTNEGERMSLRNYTVGSGWSYYAIHYSSDENQKVSCTANKTISGSCTKCKQTVSNYEIPHSALGHNYVLGTLTKATTTKNGSQYGTCSRCKDKKQYLKLKKIASVKSSPKKITYDGKAHTPNVVVKDSDGNLLTSDLDYKVSIDSKSGKKVGKYSATVKFKGNYSGTSNATFYIIPKGTSISDLTAKKGGFKLTWVKQAKQTTGYQIQYSTSPKFKKATTKTVKKATTVSGKFSKLKSGKTYYVRIRTYKTVKSKKYYSKWSETGTVVTK